VSGLDADAGGRTGDDGAPVGQVDTRGYLGRDAGETERVSGSGS
jgi:hypothetical protein